MTADLIAQFVARQRDERVAAGLPATIVDADAINQVAALVANKPVVAAYYSTMARESAVPDVD